MHHRLPGRNPFCYTAYMQCTEWVTPWLTRMVDYERKEASPRQSFRHQLTDESLSSSCRRVYGLVYRRAIKEEILYLRNKDTQQTNAYFFCEVI